MPVDARDILTPRETGRFITPLCKDVKINDDKVKQTAILLADEFKTKNFSLSSWKAHPLHPKEANENAIAIIFAIDVLNFSFWSDVPGRDYAVKYGGKLHTGYWSVVAALKRASDEGKPVYSAKYMSDICYEDFSEVFHSDTEINIPLLSKRWEGYTESGKALIEHFDGSFVNCVRKANKDAVALVKLIVDYFPSFRDEATFGSRKVSFYKRAQILVADIWCCFEGHGLGEFTNIHEMTMFADYRVPQSLHYFGILEYSDHLRKTLLDRVFLPPGDRIELEIRSTSIEATERLVEAVKRMLIKDGAQSSQLVTVNAITVDNFLWDYTRDHRDKFDQLPFHLVRTIFY